MTLAELKNNPQYYLHHTAAARGYVSRKIDHPEPHEYSGKFGTGYTVERPRWDTTRYIYIDYYIRKGDK